MTKKLTKNSAKLTKRELRFLIGRIQEELSLGLQCNEQEDLDIMNRIMTKLEKQLS